VLFLQVVQLINVAYQAGA